MSDCCNEFEFTSPQGTFYMDGGIRGKDGVTFYPHVSAAGVLSWTNDGGKQNPDPVNIKGADGMSAYAAAQQAGFTGTEAEFNAYLSGIGELSEDVDNLKSAVSEEIDGVISVKQTFVVSTYDDHEMRINPGGINANGADTTSNTRCRTRYFDIVPSRRYIIRLRSADYVIINAFEYSTTSAGASVKQRIPLTDDNTIIFNALDGVYFARICFAKVDKTATITETDRGNILNALELYAIADPSLTKAGAPADAKVTGDRLTALESFASDTGVTVDGETVDIDPGTLTSGYVNINNGGIYSSSSGLGVTDYIDIHDFVKIAYLRLRSTSATATTGMCFYDVNKVWCGGIVSLKSQQVAGYDTQLTIADVPDGAHYARFTGYIDTATYGDFIVKGIKPSLPNDISNVARAPQIGNIFCVSSTLPNIPTSADVFAAYDELVANYPLIMSKNTLTSGSLNNYEYVFSTGNYNTKGRRTRDSVIAKPKILVTSGTHGIERSAVISLYNFVKAMCENVYTLNDVINPVEYHIIPVVCPWGYDNNSRVNSNGVNINRNFATSDWVQTETGDDYSGASAGDQLETQVVQNWLTTNNDAEIYIDFHNSAFADEISALLGLSTQDHLKAKMCYLQSVNKIVPYLKNARNLGQYNVFAYTGNTDIPGTAKGYGEEHGVMSFTLETSNNVENHGKYGAFVNAIGCEMFGATIKGMVKYVLS